MNENFELLYYRIVDVLNCLDKNAFIKFLTTIKGNTICTGSGGSKVVAYFASEVLEVKNNNLTNTVSPRDLLYMNLNLYKNILIISHSGKNLGVETALNNDLRHILLTAGQVSYNNTNLLSYGREMLKERSFIAIAATMIPVSLLLDYYTNGKSLNIIEKVFNNLRVFNVQKNQDFEVMSGKDTKVAASYLDSTIVEVGLGSCTIHDKYDYCHGRSTLSKTKNSTLIYLVKKYTELDRLLLEETKGMYKEIIILDSSLYIDPVIASYNLLLASMFLTKSLAEAQNKDLSNVNYASIVKKIYKFNGEMK